ncbi:MAG: hypothetical protein ISS53_01560 [Dehalococcoidia bacterium]|nr:hypothetical protein [Dehalococcoidia bacterium]
MEELQCQPLELLVRERARIVLSEALEEEITEFLERGRDVIQNMAKAGI